MTKMQITTLRGNKIELYSLDYELKGAVEIKGRIETFSHVMLKYNSQLGHYVDLGPIKAVISADVAKEIEETFIKPKDAHYAALRAKAKAEKEAFLNSDAGKSWLLTKRMERPDSDY